MNSSMDLSLSKLKQLPIFRDLDDDLNLQILAQASRRRLTKDEMLCRKGDPPGGIYLLLKGQMQVFDIGVDGREVGLNLLRAPVLFGELSVLDGQPRSAHIVAIEPAEVITIPRQVALHVFCHNPQAAMAMFRHLTGIARRLTRQQYMLSIPSAAQRLHVLLHGLAQVMPGGLVAIPDLPRQKELAMMVNTSRETVSRTLHKLVLEGIVEKDNKRLIVRRPDLLQRLAEHT